MYQSHTKNTLSVCSNLALRVPFTCMDSHKLDLNNVANNYSLLPYKINSKITRRAQKKFATQHEFGTTEKKSAALKAATTSKIHFTKKSDESVLIVARCVIMHVTCIHIH